ncbi:MAG: hypothetical protein HY823_04165 [Acidobacteria bacterium]|nr:hypothetical protein [Acidobacteriota bacterium]
MVWSVRTEGHDAQITVTLAPNPQGITGSATIPQGGVSGTLFLTIPDLTPAGTFPLEARGNDGWVTRSATFNLAVAAGKDFSLALGSIPPIPCGQSASLGVTATRVGGHNRTITLGIANNPQGIIGTGSIEAGKNNGALLVNVPLAATPGVHDLVLTGQDGILSHTLAFQLRVSNPGSIAVLAGVPLGEGSLDGSGPGAAFATPRGVAWDATGNAFVADTNNNTLRKVTSAGVVSTIAGFAGMDGSTDGTGSAARFSLPSDLVEDGSGNLVVVDTVNHRLRRVTGAGVVTTLAGSGFGAQDGPAATARFAFPRGIALAPDGTLVIADTSNHTIRTLTPSGSVGTLAGLAGTPGSADGMGGAARFRSPNAVCVDAGGVVYVADSGNHTIRTVAPTGEVRTLAGSAGLKGFADGAGTAARFFSPRGIAVDGAGVLTVADTGNQVLRRVSSTGEVSTWAGGAGERGVADGPGPTARFNAPTGLRRASGGDLLVADSGSSTIRKVTPSGFVSTLAGEGTAPTGCVDGQGASARFGYQNAAVMDPSGNVFVADGNFHVVRKITPDGTTSTLAGAPGVPGSTDGPGNLARFNGPFGIAMDVAGNLYVSEIWTHTIRKITPAGEVSTVAGSAGLAGSTDAVGTAARFSAPVGLAMDSFGNLYVADSGNLTIRKITSTGEVSTVAGTPGYGGSSDGFGPNARFHSPEYLACDASGNLYVTDVLAHTVRKMTPARQVSTVAGLADSPGAADGGGGSARFNHPEGIAVDPDGNIWVCDSYNHAIRKLAPSGAVSTPVGILRHGKTKPGILPASLAFPWAVASGPTGGLVITVAGAILRVVF